MEAKSEGGRTRPSENIPNCSTYVYSCVSCHKDLDRPYYAPDRDGRHWFLKQMPHGVRSYCVVQGSSGFVQHGDLASWKDMVGKNNTCVGNM